ncbi:MAG: SpoIIE family protein phosphatase [Desulfovibrionaceae bacterium]|nr:SpoIIE family protein phosphatase [Desulfovibrionaceae bacterium]
MKSLQSTFRKLTISVLIFSVLPLFAHNIRQNIVSAEKWNRDTASDTLRGIQQIYESSFLDTILIRVKSIEQEKNYLRSLAQSCAISLTSFADQTLSAEQREEAILNYAAILNRSGYASGERYKFFLERNGIDIPISNDITLDKIRQYSVSHKNMPFRELINFVRNSGSDKYECFSYNGHEFLVYACPVPRSSIVLCTAVNLQDLSSTTQVTLNYAKEARKKVLLQAADNVHGIASVLNRDDLSIVLTTVSSEGDLHAVFPTEEVRSALQNGHFSFKTRIGSQNYTCYLMPHPSFNRIYFLAIPNSLLFQTCTRIIAEQCLIFGFFLILSSMVLSFCFKRKILIFLEQMKNFSQKLPSRGFTVDEAILNAELPTSLDNEIGELARSYSTMILLRNKNVKELLQITASKEHLESELKTAQSIQLGMIPADPVDTSLCMTQGLTVPARVVGGDLYDVFYLDEDTLCVCIGDVSGKGMSASLMMCRTMTLIRACVSISKSLTQSVQAINDMLCSKNPCGMFVSMLIGVYSLKTGALRFVNAGHPVPVRIMPSESRMEHGASPNLVLGLMPNIAYQEHTLNLRKGESLLFYTDGVSEAYRTNQKKEMIFYGEKGILNFCNSRLQDLDRNFCRDLLQDIRQFTGDGEQCDDITILLLQRKA